MRCPFRNRKCLCQTCVKSWLNCGEKSPCTHCQECDVAQKAEHNLLVCTNYEEKPGAAQADG